MIYFILVLLIIVFIYLYDYKGSHKGRLASYNLLMLVFILLVGLRYRIGSDTIAYEQSFNLIPKIGKLTFHYITEISDYEAGYTVLMSLSKTLFGDFWCFLLIQSIIVNISLFTFFKNNSANPFTSILLYFVVLYYFINCEAARQGIALAIIIYAWKNFTSNNLKLFLIQVLFASLFHSTALIFLLFPLLSVFKLWDRLRPNILNFSILLSIIISSYFLQQYISQLLMQYTMVGDIGGRIYAYYADADELSKVSVLTQVLYCLFYIIVPFYCLRRIRNNYKNYENLASVIMLCSLINVASVIPMVYRLTYYFFPFYFILLSETLFCSTDKYKFKKNVNVVVLCSLILFTYYKIQPYFYEDGSTSNMRYYMRFYPYNSIIDKGLDENREQIYRGL